MKVSDKPLWDDFKARNKTGLGLLVVLATEAWADAAEAAMARGVPFKEAIYATFPQADEAGGGLSGKGLSWVKRALNSCWEHGEQFRALNFK